MDGITRFDFSKDCYYDMQYDRLVYTKKGEVFYIDGQHKAVLRKLLIESPKEVPTSTLESCARCDNNQLRKIIERLRKYELLDQCIINRFGAYQACEMVEFSKEESEKTCLPQIESIVVPAQVQGEQKEDAYTFLSKVIANSSKETIESVDMAFHGGDQWLYHGQGNQAYLLNQMIKKRIPLRVLVNTSASVEDICPHMRQEGAKYVGFEKAISDWKEKAAESDGLLNVGVLAFPLLHQVYLVRKKDGTGSARVAFYVYFKDFSPANEIVMSFHEGSREFDIIKDEFDYLWGCAEK